MQLLFNIFLFFRFTYEITLYYQMQPSAWLESILDITGISYHYTADAQLFNLIPLLINAAIGFQYLTYTSTIYSSGDNRTALLAAYR